MPIGDPAPRPMPLSTRRELHLPAGTHAFSVEFAALDRTVPRRNQYAYRMQRLRARRRLAAAEERACAERAVRHSEWKYRSIFDQVTQGVFQSTVDGRFLAANPALARMFGYTSPEELLGEARDIETQIFVRPSRRQEMRRLLEAFGAVHDFQYEARRRPGGTLWISADIRTVTDDAGNVVYLGTAEDISDRKQAEETEGALREVLENARQEWQRTFDAIEAYIFILDESGTVMRINRAVRDGAGRASYRECLGRNVEELGGGEPWHTAHELARAVAYGGRVARAGAGPRERPRVGAAGPADPGRGHRRAAHDRRGTRRQRPSRQPWTNIVDPLTRSAALDVETTMRANGRE